ncbi:MAG: prepilin-type N-terminal cleavage/methylation domain-containing protein [Deltaproteobacteria bacterium]|nr:prepilin-type N-terminal cleavage/methylation domain-containing protein [Deltaproteobacteria bacterium]
MKNARFKDIRGFSLLETVMALVLLGIVGLSTAMMLRLGADSFSMVSSRTEALNKAQLTLHRMSQELLALNVGDLQNIAENRIDFVDGDGIESNFRSVASPEGHLQIYRSADLLADSLNKFRIAYFGADGTEISEPSEVNDVRRILIEMSIAAGEDYGTVEINRSVYIRSYYYSNYN